jgi:hypothetical protein
MFEICFMYISCANDESSSCFVRTGARSFARLFVLRDAF